MKKSAIITASLLSIMCLASCGKDTSSSKDVKSSNAAKAAESVQTPTENAVPSADYSPADLAGEWIQTDFSNILTVDQDGSFSLKYEGGGTRFGNIKIESEEHPDGSVTYWYSFYEGDSLWTGFVCPDKPFNEIYSEDGITFVRNDSGKSLPPTVPEAKDMRDALAFADRLMSGAGVETDMNAEYTADDGTVYHKSIDGLYTTTDSIRSYLYSYMTEQFISSHYDYLFGTEHPKCIDVNGELYIEYRPVGGIYAFEDADPNVIESGNGYSIEIKNNNYGAEDTVVIDVVKDNGRWKINEVQDSF